MNQVLTAVKNRDEKFLSSLSESQRADVAKLLEDMAGADPSLQEWAHTILEELASAGTSQSYQALLARDFIRKPVDIEQFCKDKDYAGKYGEYLYGCWLNELKKVFNPDAEVPVYEWGLTGAIGIGKNTAVSFAHAYRLYWISCLADPCEYYGLMPGSAIIFGIYSVTREKASSVGYGHVREIVDGSPYFSAHFPKDPKLKHGLEFPHHVSVRSGSTELHAIGENLLCLQIDEVNFMRGEGDKGQAYALYEGCRRRVRSRFLQKGRVPGLMVLISSRRAHADFLEEHIRVNKNTPGFLVSDFSLWEVKRDRYKKETFKLAVGNKMQASRILEPEELPPAGMEVLDVPIDFEDDFKKDIDGSVRDIAGRPTTAVSPLIRDAASVWMNVHRTRPHPFSREEVSVSHLDRTELMHYFQHQLLMVVQHSRMLPSVNPGSPRFIHVDLAKSGDSAGIAMGHVYAVDRRELEVVMGIEVPELRPNVYLDFMLRIVPPLSGEIGFSKIRRFILALRGIGYNIKRVTYDGWQSVGSLQDLEAQGIDVGVLSVDKDDVAYIYLRQAILDIRLNAYFYPPFLDELLNLEHDITKRKVDHPERMKTLSGKVVKGSKDVSDCVASVTKQCVEYANSGGLFISSTPNVPGPAGERRVGAVGAAAGLLSVLAGDEGGDGDGDWVLRQ